jgi:putative hydrolase of the HAD superfamily
MIKGIIFDVGGVLIRTEDRSHRRALEEQFNLGSGGADRLVFDSEMGQRAQRGVITDEALWKWVGQTLALSSHGLAQFRQGFWAGDVLDTELISLTRRLKARYKTAIISNATDALESVLKGQHAIDDAFDVIVGSATEHIMKPDPAIYRLALDRLDLEAAETVFIDDFAHNIVAARQLGMHAILFHEELDIVAELAGLGVNV